MDFYQIFPVRSFVKNQIKRYQKCYPKFVSTFLKWQSNPILSKIASHISIHFNALFLNGNSIESYQKRYPLFLFTLILFVCIET